MAPPLFSDLGKSASDVFEKSYPLGTLKFEANSQDCKNPQFKIAATHKFEDGTFEGNVESKFKFPEYGVTLTNKWNTSNDLVVEAACEGKLSPGLKLAVVGGINADTGAKNGEGKVFYKMNNAIAEGSVALGDNTNTMVNGAVVGGYKGFLGGYQLAYDSNDGSLKKNNLALLYCAPNVQVRGNVTNMGEKLSASIYNRILDRAEVAAQISYVPNGNGSSGISSAPRRTSTQSNAPEPSRNDVRRTLGQSTAPDDGEAAPPPPPPPQLSGSNNAAEDKNINFAIGGRYLLDANNSIRAKINLNSQLGVSYETKIKDGTTVTAATLVDLKNMSAGGHKVGLGIEFII